MQRSISTGAMIVLTLAVGTGLATTIEVPADLPTIQAGIDAATSFDTVLVAPGTYYENINFRAKNIVVTSHFVIGLDPVYIDSTIIDGSSPAHPDTASVVIIHNCPFPTTILQGFTLTGGAGTRWLDPHGAGWYREGGGILTEFSSPVIQYNKIINNIVTNTAGVVSTGGGGIRTGDGDPLIRNNIIANNRARYGAGIVLNYAKSTIRNNVISDNIGGESYAGSGIWKLSGSPTLVENNAVVNNVSALPGGGIFAWTGHLTIRNSILWGNVAPSDSQIGISGGTVLVEYCDVQSGYAGSGNIDEEPYLYHDDHYLMYNSMCVDAGDPDSSFNDPEDAGSPGDADWPALGALRNDIGAYGGPDCFAFLPSPDIDEDGVPNRADNCPLSENSDQTDSDGDNWGDECDVCPNDSNPDQADVDLDGIGDLCDNCPADLNQDQADLDSDGFGDVCDNCPDSANSDQSDIDGDSIGDVCDNCPEDPNSDQDDPDADGIGSVCDNCPNDFNPDQSDLNGNGVGDVCDYKCGDADGSEEVDIDDVVFLITYIFAAGPPPEPIEAGDVDCSGGIDIDDVVYLIQFIFAGGPQPCEDCN
jgi:hypothetical protein